MRRFARLLPVVNVRNIFFEDQINNLVFADEERVLVVQPYEVKSLVNAAFTDRSDRRAIVEDPRLGGAVGAFHPYLSLSTRFGRSAGGGERRALEIQCIVNLEVFDGIMTYQVMSTAGIG